MYKKIRHQLFNYLLLFLISNFLFSSNQEYIEKNGIWDYTLDEYGEPLSLIECLAIGGIWDYYNETCGDGICDSSDPCVGEIDAGICVGNEPELPDQLTLSQNYPNPFNPITKIDYSVPSPERISIYLYDNSAIVADII